jgi:hypothetical protein
MAFTGTERKSCIKCDLLTFDGRLFTFRSMEAMEDDGQLHTLGLLERLRSETNLV